MLSPPSIKWSPTAMRVRRGPLSRRIDAHEREIGGAAADVDDDGELHSRGAGGHVFLSAEPVVERGLRLFEQVHARNAGELAGRERERARAFVERCGDREDDLLLIERRFGMRAIPRGANVCEKAGARIDGRDLGNAFFGAPRKNRRGAIDARVREPALGTDDETTRHLRAELAGELTDDVRRRARRNLRQIPRQPPCAFVQLGVSRVIAKRVQQRPRRDLARRDELIELEDLGRGATIVRAHERDDGVGRSEIDADDESRVGQGARG